MIITDAGRDYLQEVLNQNEMKGIRAYFAGMG